MKRFYVGIGAIIEKNEKYLVLKRSSEKDYGANTWEVVTGRLESEEHPEKGVVREVKEETNFDVDIVMPIDSGFFYRGGNEFPMVFIIYWCKYKGGELKITWEHSEFKWVTLEEALVDPQLKVFHNRFRIIKNLKKYLPNDFSIHRID